MNTPVYILRLVGLCFAASLFSSTASAESQHLLASLWDKLPPHPRLFANAERWTELRRQVKGDPIQRKLYAVLRANAEDILTSPPVTYVDTGAFMLGPMGQGQRRIITLSFVYRIEGDPRFLARAREEMHRLASLPNWYDVHFLDTAEATMGLGVGLDWLYDELKPEERTAFTQAIVSKGLRKSWAPDGSDLKWVTANTNWNQVCHGGLTVGALAIAESEPQLARKIVERAVANVHFATEEYGPGGAYPEGPSYWGYGTSFQVILMEALRTVFGTTCDLEKYPGFLQSPDFIAHLTGPTGNTFNYADAQSSTRSLTPAMFWFARELGRADLVATDLATLDRWYNELRDGPKAVIGGDRQLPLALLYWDPKLATGGDTVERPLSWFSGGGIQPVVAMRSKWRDPRATFVAFKGGRMPNSHAHMDVGTFVLESDGVRWAIDPGAESYSKVRGNGIKNEELFDTRTQDSKRWSIFRVGPDGHNLLRFDNRLQQVDGRADIKPAPQHPKDTAWVIDLTSIYSRQAAAVHRGFALLPDRRVVIQDEWTAGANAIEVSWQWLTYAEAVVDQSGLLLRQKGETLRLRVTAPEDSKIEVQDVSQPRRPFDSPNPGLTRILLRARTGAGQAGRIVVVAEPQGRDSKRATPVIVPLSKW